MHPQWGKKMQDMQWHKRKEKVFHKLNIPLESLTFPNAYEFHLQNPSLNTVNSEGEHLA